MLSDIILKSILRTNSDNVVLQDENEEIEFKRVYDATSKEAKAKYTKTLASFYNHKGGYLIFGVDNNSKELIGLTDFIQPDNADITNDINTYFSPALSYYTRKVEIEDKTVFVIYVSKRDGIPAVCIKGHQAEITEGIIYKRYNAKTAPIKSGDLINLLHELRGEVMQEVNSVLIADTKAKWKPNFYLSSMKTAHGTFNIHINNSGESAFVQKIELLEGEFYPPQKYPNYEIRKGSKLVVDLRYKSNGLNARIPIKLYFEWKDSIGTIYKSNIIGKNGSLYFENIEI